MGAWWLGGWQQGREEERTGGWWLVAGWLVAGWLAGREEGREGAWMVDWAVAACWLNGGQLGREVGMTAVRQLALWWPVTRLGLRLVALQCTL